MAAFFAPCAKGLEYLLRDELAALGADDAREALAGVHFSGGLELAMRACLWSRLASRILLQVAEFPAADGDALYAGMAAIDWGEHLAPGATFAIDASGGSAALRHTQFIARRAKDAIVDQLREASGERPDVDLAEPDLRLQVRIHRGRATVSVDLAGTPLHRRGWRQEQGTAPLKETLACAMLLRAGWPAQYRAGGHLFDPMCGAGTLPIEAARMAADVAPGLERVRFGLEGWAGHEPGTWAALREEAASRAHAGLASLRPVFHGSDHDPRMIALAARNAVAAGVGEHVQFTAGVMEAVQPPADANGGLVITNPPYGERLGERQALVPLYRSLGERLRGPFADWDAALIVADEDLGRATGLRAARRYVLYNGALKCQLLIVPPRDADAPAPRPARPLSPGAQQVANRIARTDRHLRRQRQREGISCWRAYDADLPEYAAAIDVHTAVGRDGAQGFSPSAPEAWLHVQEYAAPPQVPEALARERLRDLVRAAGDALGVPRERIALKRRERGKGGSKYGRLDARGEFLVVEEGGLKLRVNLFDYLDTGLFLDHRPIRLRLQQEARGLRVLNLFCYTGTASVHAAAGGARSTTSVDLSATYLEWATRNFVLNGIGGPAHQLVQADVMQWLRHDQGRYDLVFVDPPTFSNSARAGDFDVQTDHGELLRLCGERLARGGLILFSNNARRFRLDAALEEAFAVRDITPATIPFDFARTPRIHRCWELRKRE